ncbi:NINE protein [Chryseobacterium sp. Mn2064]|uniref:NINE protein n=1 Tax=Chryseobacterium sp. Mn2064 TaxID=3395263 RepID=UPI003BCD4239
MKDKNTAGILALLLGGIGVHKFYLNKPVAGILYLLFCWTFVPCIIAFVEAIIFFTMEVNAFNTKYNSTPNSRKAATPQFYTQNHSSNAEEVEKLMKLKQSGALSEEEFNTLKSRLLGL